MTTDADRAFPVAFGAARRQLVPTAALQTAVWIAALVLIVGPLLPLVYASFRSQAFYLPGSTWSLTPYRTLFDDPAYWHAILNTLGFAAMTTVLAVSAGTGFAVLVNRTNMPHGRWLRWLIVAPIVIPPLGLIVGWTSISGPSGYITQLVHQDLGWPVWNLSSLPGMAVLGAVVTIPITFLTCQVALQASDSSLETAALASGAAPVTVLRTITLPLLRPALLNSAVLVFALSLETLGIPLFIGTPANINLYASYLYNGWQNSPTPDPSFVSAGAVLLLVVVTILLVVRTMALGSEQRFIVPSTGADANEQPLDIGRCRYPAMVIVSGFVVCVTIIPIVGLVAMSAVKELTILVAPWHLWTASNWTSLLTTQQFRNALLNSLLIAAVGSLLTVGFVAIASTIAHRSQFRFRRTLPALLTYPRAIPGIILGVGFFWSYLIASFPGGILRNNVWGEMLALCVRNITIAYVVLYPSLARLSPEVDQAASASGAHWRQRVQRVTLPMIKPALLAALVLMFITLLSDYDPLVFLQKPGTEVMGVTMLQAWEKGEPGLVAAMAVVQLALVAVALALATRFTRRFRRG
jgi:iron(III) transport system permease protein